MEIDATILCPWCGQRFEVSIDTSQASHRFVTDCEVCCRPINIAVDCTPGEILGLEAETG